MDRRRALIYISAGGCFVISACKSYPSQQETFRIVGYNDMEEMLAGLVRLAAEQGLPYRFELDLPATKAAPSALLDGRSTLAPMGAEMAEHLQEAFVPSWGGRPIAFRIAHASLSASALSSPTGILVNIANPLSSITVAQARRIFAGADQGRGPRNWNDMGLQGEWSDRAIAINGLDETTAIGKFMLGKFCAVRFDTAMRRHFQSRDVAAAVAEGIGAIGFGNLNHAQGKVRALAILDEAGAAHGPTGDAIASGRYPFDRHLLIYARCDAKGRIEPDAARFLELALSPAGQQSIGAGSLGYIPLNESERVVERAKLAAVGGRAADVVSLSGSAPTILETLAGRWQGQLATAASPITLHFDRTFGPPLGKHDEGLAEFLQGKRDFAFLTREIDEDDLATFRKHHDHDPLIMPVAEGAWNKFGLVDAVTIIVNAQNPLASLNFCQLTGIFFRSPTAQCRVSEWGDLGVPEYGNAHVRAVGAKEWFPHESAKALTVRRKILESSQGVGWWRTVSDEIDDRHVVEQVATDPFAIGFTAVGHLRPGVRMVPLVPAAGAEAVLPTEETIASGRYPLARTIDLVVAREADGTLKPPLVALAEALLSMEGQAAIVKDGTFRPLARNRLVASLAMLGVAALQKGCTTAGAERTD